VSRRISVIKSPAPWRSREVIDQPLVGSQARPAHKSRCGLYPIELLIVATGFIHSISTLWSATQLNVQVVGELTIERKLAGLHFA
jgi:hypothetical protein